MKHHPGGEAFASKLIDAGMDVIKQSGVARYEHGEAKVATASLTDAIAAGRDTASAVRAEGDYIGSELDRGEDMQSAYEARAIPLAVGIGSRISLSTYTGVQRMLEHQINGLQNQKTILKRFGAPKLEERVTTALKVLREAGVKQSKEQIEANNEQIRLEVALENAGDTIARAIRLVNARSDDAPEALLRDLLHLEGRHWRVFADPKATEKPADVGPPVASKKVDEPV